jgi:hypothetical protein
MLLVLVLPLLVLPINSYGYCYKSNGLGYFSQAILAKMVAEKLQKAKVKAEAVTKTY